MFDINNFAQKKHHEELLKQYESLFEVNDKFSAICKNAKINHQLNKCVPSRKKSIYLKVKKNRLYRNTQQ